MRLETALAREVPLPDRMNVPDSGESGAMPPTRFSPRRIPAAGPQRRVRRVRCPDICQSSPPVNQCPDFVPASGSFSEPDRRVNQRATLPATLENRGTERAAGALTATRHDSPCRHIESGLPPQLLRHVQETTTPRISTRRPPRVNQWGTSFRVENVWLLR